MSKFKKYLEAAQINESLGKNREYRSRDDMVRANLAVHHSRMEELMKGGETKEEASKQSFNEIQQGMHKKKIKELIKSYVAKRNPRPIKEDIDDDEPFGGYEDDNEVGDQVQIGDFVDFGAYGKLYVVSNISDDKFWVTDIEEDRFNRDARGWSIRKSYAKEILQSADDAEQTDDSDMQNLADVFDIISTKFHRRETEWDDEELAREFIIKAKELNYSRFDIIDFIMNAFSWSRTEANKIYMVVK